MISDNTGANLAWAATFNGEQDVYFMRILPFDCNNNGIADSDDIADDTSADVNENGVPDECENLCPWDLDGNGDVGVTDLFALLGAWGTDPGGPPDFDGDGDVGVTDLFELLGSWGPCL